MSRQKYPPNPWNSLWRLHHYHGLHVVDLVPWALRVERQPMSKLAQNRRSRLLEKAA